MLETKENIITFVDITITKTNKQKQYFNIYITWPHYHNHLQFSQYLDITPVLLLKTYQKCQYINVL